MTRRPLDPLFLLITIIVLTQVSFGGSRILVSLYAISFGASPFQIGLIISLSALTPTVVSVYAGRLADRIGHRLPMLYGAAALIVAMLIPAVWPALPALFLSGAVAGAGFSFFNVPAQALVGAISSPERRAFNFSTLAMGYSIASLVGPLVVGASVDHTSPRWAYAILAAILLAPAALLAWKRRVPVARSGEVADGKRSVLDLLRKRSLLAMFIASGACVSGWDLFSFFMPIYGTRIGLSATLIGVVISTFGVATLVVRIFIPRLTRRFGGPRTLACAMCVGAIGFGAIPFFEHVAPLMLAAFVMGLGLGCGQPLTMMMTYNRSPAGRAAEANGLRTIANNFTHMVVPLAFGALGSAFGIGPVFWLNSVLLVGGAYCGGKRFPS